jgi:acylphosphatase
VEVWAEGSAEKLERLVQWLHRGPAGARVDSVTLEQRRARGSYRRFEIEG